jgi:perosamine synthetase
MNIPLYKTDITDNEIEAVNKVLKSGKLSRGGEVENFEIEFAKYVDKKYAIAVNSGTSGLHISVRALGWKKDDEVITTPFSYIASANSLLFESVTPVFVDIEPDTLNIDSKLIEDKITSKTKGILLVHIFGLPAHTEEIEKIREKYNLKILEDSCEAIGRTSNEFMVSKIGELSVYGFYENKQMTSGGEGGMIVTDNKELADLCKSMRDQGRSNKKDWINNVIVGFNFRMTEIQATFGIEQLKRLDINLKNRESIAESYSNLLRGTSGLMTPHDFVSKKRSWFVYYVILKNKNLRDLLHLELGKKGIETSLNYFTPITKFPAYSFCEDYFPITEDVSSRILVLPLFNNMKNDEIEYVTKAVKEILK